MKKLRKAAGLTQKDVAAALGVTVAAVSSWEHGETRPKAKRLLDLARLYGCTVDAILKEVN